MVQSVDRALNIIEILKKEPDGLGVTEVASRMKVAKSTAHRLISSLEKYNYIQRTQRPGYYTLGLKYLELNQIVLENLDIVSIAHRLLVDLTASSGEITHLGMLQGLELVYIDKVESDKTIRIYSQTGIRAPLYCTGIGKAMLAFQGEGYQKKYINEVPRKKFTPSTCYTNEQLQKELEHIRKVGYALDDEEHEEGVRCVAAPIFDHLGNVVYAISVTGPAHRMTDDKINSLIPFVSQTAQSVSENLGYKH